MRDALAQFAYPVLERGLRLRDQLNAGESPDLDFEQAVLRDLLERNIDGDVERSHDVQRSVRYALVSWLDEIFTAAGPWADAWNEQKLEMAIYGTNDRSWHFWQEAQQAAQQNDREALEIYYLCVMLGFRGQLRADPPKLDSWIARTRIVVGQVREPQWPDSLEDAPPCAARPLTGENSLRQMCMTAAVAAIVCIPALTFAIVHWCGRS